MFAERMHGNDQVDVISLTNDQIVAAGFHTQIEARRVIKQGWMHCNLKISLASSKSKNRRGLGSSLARRGSPVRSPATRGN